MIQTFARAAAAATLAGVAACQTAPAADSGFLSGYDRLQARDDTVRASIRQHRDEALAAGVERVWLEPATLVGDAGAGLPETERAMVLREVDRQVCYEMSERFTLAAAATDGAARVRVGVVDIRPTGAAGSGVAAVANALIPGPGTVRVPGTTGGLAAEAELVAGGRQVAALAWARNATVVGTDTPSLSRVGDALQLAEPFGDAVGDAFAPADRAARPIPDPDPCARFGPRTQPAGFVTRLVTGLYVPEVNTGSRAAEPPAE